MSCSYCVLSYLCPWNLANDEYKLNFLLLILFYWLSDIYNFLTVVPSYSSVLYVMFNGECFSFCIFPRWWAVLIIILVVLCRILDQHIKFQYLCTLIGILPCIIVQGTLIIFLLLIDIRSPKSHLAMYFWVSIIHDQARIRIFSGLEMCPAFLSNAKNFLPLPNALEHRHLYG